MIEPIVLRIARNVASLAEHALRGPDEDCLNYRAFMGHYNEAVLLLREHSHDEAAQLFRPYDLKGTPSQRETPPRQWRLYMKQLLFSALRLISFVENQQATTDGPVVLTAEGAETAAK
jgi:hypothetical protein